MVATEVIVEIISKPVCFMKKMTNK